jgi:hypothetical protein
MTAYSQQQEIFPLSKMSKLFLVPMQPPIQCVTSFCLAVGAGGMNWLFYDIDHLAPSSAKVKNKLIYTSTPPICPNGVDGDYFIV